MLGLYILSPYFARLIHISSCYQRVEGGVGLFKETCSYLHNTIGNLRQLREGNQ